MSKINKVFNFLVLLFILSGLPFFSLIHAQETQSNDPSSKEENNTVEEPQKAVTEAGENVLLYSDGTWEYTPENTAEQVKRTINTAKFVKPTLSQDFFKGSNVNYEIYYNKDKWKILSKSINEMAEYSLIHKDNNAYALVIPEKVSIPLEKLRDIVLDNAHKVSPKVKILKEEERNVNGSKVIMLQIKAKIQKMDIIYVYYLVSGEKTSIQIAGFTTEELFPEYQHDIEDLLNGLVIKEVEKTVK